MASFSGAVAPGRGAWCVLTVGFVLATLGWSTAGNAADTATALRGDPAQAAAVETIARDAMATYHLKAIIVRVTRDGKDVYTGAMGESMTGVPATPDMHYRNGAFAFTYIGEIVAEMIDQQKVRLDDKLSKWMPELPSAERITIKNLLNMTSGYADYVYQPEVLDGLYRDPFRQWTSEELIQIGVSKPFDFEPGTNWGYSHTNYVILGRVLEKIAGKPMADIMQAYIIAPMGLRHTSSNGHTPAILAPVLHVFSSERREALQLPPDIPFYEETTFWNPSWTTAEGAVQTTDIYDMTTSMELVGNGKLVSPETYKAQVGNNLAGFGSKDPTGRCKACNRLTNERSYGLGVVLLGPWITQTKDFAGSGATGGYLPSQKLTISVVTTYTAQAFDSTGANTQASRAIFTALATALAGAEAPPP